MLQFAKDGMIPPGGVFFYADPVNGVPLLQDMTSLQNLASRVRAAYVTAGKTPPEPLHAIVEAYICEHVPRGFCVGQYKGSPVEFMTPQVVKERSRAAATSCSRVDPGTVKSRMAVCGQCPANSRTLCLSCTGMTEWAVTLAGRTHIAMDDSLGICKHDRILLSLSVSLKGLPLNPDGRPEKCWRINDSK